LVVLPFSLKTTEIYIFCIHLGLRCILSVICVFLCILWYWLYLYVFSLYWLASKGSFFCIFSFSPSQEVCLLCASKEFNWKTLVFLVTQYRTAYPSWTPGLASGFEWGRVAQTLVFCVVFVLVLFSHCIVSPS
jgi:hypothetical protein